MRIWIRNTDFFLANLRIYTNCGLGHEGNLRIKFADVRFADWHTSEICGFCDMRNEPKNLRICDLLANKKNLRAHLLSENEVDSSFEN